MKKTIILMILIAFCPGAVFAVEKSTNNQKQLTAGQIKQIRYLSQAVLRARKNAPQDPDMVALKADLKELHSALKELWKEAASENYQKSAMSVSSGNKPSRAAKKASSKAPSAKMQATKSKARNALQKVKNRRANMSAASPSRVARKGKFAAQQQNIKMRAVAKVSELESEIAAALDDPAGLRLGNLKKLLKRTKISQSTSNEQLSNIPSGITFD